jgi:hypothetical protein
VRLPLIAREIIYNFRSLSHAGINIPPNEFPSVITNTASRVSKFQTAAAEK